MPVLKQVSCIFTHLEEIPVTEVCGSWNENLIHYNQSASKTLIRIILTEFSKLQWLISLKAVVTFTFGMQL